MSDDRPKKQEADDDTPSPEVGDAAMTDVPLLAPPPALRVVPQSYRTLLLQLSETIVDRIRAEMPAYAGRTGGRRQQLMSMAVSSALRAHLDTTSEQSSAQRKVDELFHRMGWGEAQDGHGTENLELAQQIAMRVLWEHLADHAAARGDSAQQLRDVVDGLLEYGAHLRNEMLSGHHMWSRDPYYDEDRARARLWRLFRPGTTGRISPLRSLGVDSAELAEAALEAGWTVPDEIAAIAVSYHGDPPPPPAIDQCLATLAFGRLLVLCPSGLEDEVIADLIGSATDRRVVLSWPMPPEEAGTALLWSLRALDLVQLGAIAPTPVVRCVDHITQLWLHAEPSMRRRLCQDLLEPLLAESPNSREILSETLLTWLETHDSAPAIAARLDVHPQTVRYRWRRIYEIFGEALHDPEFVVQITLVLKSSIPLWKAGDQSDFELFRGAKESHP